jgi:hypothetical protein
MKTTAYFFLLLGSVFAYSNNKCLDLRDLDEEGTNCKSFEPVLSAPENEHVLNSRLERRKCSNTCKKSGILWKLLDFFIYRSNGRSLCTLFRKT